MENKEIALVLAETADLMEIDGQDSRRFFSYRNAAQAVDTWPESVAEIVADPDWKAAEKRLRAIPGIGEKMALHLKEIVLTKTLSNREDILKRFPRTILDLLQIRDLGPKRIALIWSAFQAGSVDEVEKLGREGKLRDLPRLGAKIEQNVLKAIESWKSSAGRFLIDAAGSAADELSRYLLEGARGVRATPAGSLRRGKETIGDLDVLVTGGGTEKQIERLLAYPRISGVVARGENKVSVRITGGMQVDVRYLDRSSFGSALQYFTGSKEHNVAVRQRALKMGYSLSEYGLFRTKDNRKVAGETEEEIYGMLGLDYIPPELRENWGEIDAAEAHRLPRLVTVEDIQGDLHMHTEASDGRVSLVEMARAAQGRGLRYIAITDHSKSLAMANGLDEKRLLEQVKEIRKAEKEMDGFRIFAGSEVDIHRDGTLDLADEALAALDVVVASVHSYMNLEPAEQTDRLLRACENRYLNILAHPTGRQLLRRASFPYDFERLLAEASKRNIQLEINSFPDRLDLNERNARLAKERGVKIVISTDSHHPAHLANLRYGVQMARRAWLEKKDVLNTLPAEEFKKALKRKD